MAWSYGLFAECGASEGGARALAAHFHSWNGAVSLLGADWWCGAVPSGLSLTGPSSEAEALAMTAAGHQLYALLRTAPPVYRYALAGVETEEFRTYQELVDDDDLTVFPGLVLSQGVWTRVGRPAAFGPFSPGYRWLPYRGERT